MPRIRWMPANVIDDAPNAAPGLLVDYADDDDNFRRRVLVALDMICDVAPGRRLIEGLIERFDNSHKVMIVRGENNECFCPAATIYTRLANALIGHQETATAITSALIALGCNTEAGFQATADRINGTPRYQLEGPVQTAPGNYGVTAGHVRGWAAGTPVFPEPFGAEDLDAVKNAVLIALRSDADNGPGAGSLVRWNPDKRTITVGGEEIHRGPFLGLAHELVHAWHNACGGQIGADHGDSTTVLYEYLCTGLGEWQLAAGLGPGDPALPVSENGIRRAWDVNLRLQYA